MGIGFMDVAASWEVQVFTEEAANMKRGPVDASRDENPTNKCAIPGGVANDSLDRSLENTRFFAHRRSWTFPFRWGRIEFGRLYPPICVFDPRPDWRLHSQDGRLDLTQSGPLGSLFPYGCVLQTFISRESLTSHDDGPPGDYHGF